MTPTLPTGIQKTVKGYRVFVRLSRTILSTKTFRTGATLPEMKQWRVDQREAYKRSPQPHPTRPVGFSADAATYLSAVAGMTTLSDRERDIKWWTDIFGDMPRPDITSAAVATALATLTGSASSSNHKRTALAHLWRVLDGKSAANPVRDVPKRREPDAEPRGLPYDTIRKIFEHMPASQSKARLMVIAWTGIPHAQLARITLTDLDFKASRVFVRGRAKGRGTKGRLLPLTPDGVAAFRAFVRADAFGTFSRKNLWRALRRACKKAEKDSQKENRPISLTGVRPYDLRHSFGTAVYAASGDIRATQILMGHSKPEMTHRYTLGAVDEQVGKALAAFTARTRRKVTKKVTRRKKAK